MGELEDVTLESFYAVITAQKRKVSEIVQEIYGVNLEPLKVELAMQVADFLNQAGVNWRQDAEFLQTELGRFLQFIQRVH